MKTERVKPVNCTRLAALVTMSAALGVGICRAETIAYWQFDNPDADTPTTALTDSVGPYDLAVSSGTFVASTNKAVDPVPTPDTSPGFSGDPLANPDGTLYRASLLSPGGGGTERLTVSGDPGNAFNLAGKSFTFEGWFQHDTGSTPGGFGDMIGGTRIGSPWVGYILRMHADGNISWYCTDGSNPWGPATSSMNYNDGAFHHFAIVWQDGTGTNSTGLTDLYIDGVLEASASAPADFSATTADASDNPFAIAGRSTSGNNWDGRFDEFRFSGTALTPPEFLSAPGGPDTNAPMLAVTSPTNNATNVAIDTDLVATFNETIALTSNGVITIKHLHGGSDVVIDLAGADSNATVNVVGRDMTIDLSHNLDLSANYAVRISADAIADVAATNLFTGIADNVTWTFATELPDGTPPGITDLSPADDSQGVLPGGDLVATFDEPITLKTNGTITVTDLVDGSSSSTVTIPDARITSPNGNSLSLQLDSFLEYGTAYSVQISDDAIEDRAPTPNVFSGITDHTTWNFRTFARTPGEISVVDTGNFSQGYNASRPPDARYVLTSTDLGGFNAAGADKLVVAFSYEKPASYEEVSYGGVPMTKIASIVYSSIRVVAIFYLDSPKVAGDLVVDLSRSNGLGLTALALLNSQPGHVSPVSSALATSTTITTTGDNSLVVAAAVNNDNASNAPEAQPPLTKLFSIDSGSSAHGSGYQHVALADTTTTPTFASNNAEAMVAVEFLAVPIPAGSVLIVR